jgi:hypothetical protein
LFWYRDQKYAYNQGIRTSSTVMDDEVLKLEDYNSNVNNSQTPFNLDELIVQEENIHLPNFIDRDSLNSQSKNHFYMTQIINISR